MPPYSKYGSPTFSAYSCRANAAARRNKKELHVRFSPSHPFPRNSKEGLAERERLVSWRRTTSIKLRAGGNKKASGDRDGSPQTRCPSGVRDVMHNSSPFFRSYARKGHPEAYCCFQGYKFETLCTLPRPWGEVSRAQIEARPTERVSNKAQYCSIVSANIGPTKVCLGGEIDARKSTTYLPPHPFLCLEEYAERSMNPSLGLQVQTSTHAHGMG